MSRTLVIGDVHGGLKALEQVFARAEVTSADKLIFLGDYVDGWSESAELVQYLIDTNILTDCVFIGGNHDKWCDEWLRLGSTPNMWVQQGGQATIDSYIKTGFLTEDSHRKFFNDLRLFYVDDKNRAFIHGGYTSNRGVGHEPYEANYYWDRDLWQAALAGNMSQKALKLLRAHKEIYIGHTSTVNWDTDKPMNKCNVWNMDTGAGFYGKLTIMDVDTKEYWQSDLVKELYPDELGRG